jgi:hypothetical protein
MRKPVEDAGFIPPSGRRLGRVRRIVVLAELITSAALALSTIALVTVMSVSIAHANPVDGVIGNEGSLFGIALLLGLMFIGVSGLSLPGRRIKKR